MVRAPSFDKNGIKKGAWSEDEDNKLRAYIQTYGHPNWRELPKFAGLARCGKSCRLRWMNYLRPNVKHGGFTKEEDDVIIRAHKKLGNKWSMMAAMLPGRSDNEIKNYWHTHLKNRFERKDDQTHVLKTENFGSVKISDRDVSPNNGCDQLINPIVKSTQTEVEILLAVLSSSTSSSSSSTSELSSSCSLSVADYGVTPQVSDNCGSLWIDDPFLSDEGSIISSNDDVFSSFEDYVINDMYLWST